MRKTHSTKQEEAGFIIKSSDFKLFAFLIYVQRISVFRLTDYENALWTFDSICSRNFMIFTIFFIILASDHNNKIPSTFSREYDYYQQSTTKKFYYYYKGIIEKFLVMKIIPKFIIQSSTNSATHYHYQATQKQNFTIQKYTTKKIIQLEIHNPNDIDFLHDIHMNPNLYYSNYLQQVYKSSTLFLI